MAKSKVKKVMQNETTYCDYIRITEHRIPVQNGPVFQLQLPKHNKVLELHVKAGVPVMYVLIEDAGYCGEHEHEEGVDVSEHNPLVTETFIIQGNDDPIIHFYEGRKCGYEGSFVFEGESYHLMSAELQTAAEKLAEQKNALKEQLGGALADALQRMVDAKIAEGDDEEE